jgi:hypothetical protein
MTEVQLIVTGPWLADAASPARSLAEAKERPESY